jgi:TPR repeat protein
MSELNEAETSSRRNPLLWIALVVIALIVFVFVSGDRGDTMSPSKPEVASADSAASTSSGNIDRSLLVPPGMRARQYVEQLRADGKPYPLPQVFEKAQKYLQEGSLADAHLLYFFAAREEHLPAIMHMGEMSDPTLFRAEDSLLDNADVVQSYKWYQKAATMGHQAAAERIDSLQQWAVVEAEAGNPHARQLRLNFR